MTGPYLNPDSTLADRFTYRPPTPATIPVFEDVRGRVWELADYLDTVLPESREKALALTKLEETLAWANACVARRGARTATWIDRAH